MQGRIFFNLPQLARILAYPKAAKSQGNNVFFGLNRLINGNLVKKSLMNPTMITNEQCHFPIIVGFNPAE